MIDTLNKRLPLPITLACLGLLTHGHRTVLCKPLPDKPKQLIPFVFCQPLGKTGCRDRKHPAPDLTHGDPTVCQIMFPITSAQDAHSETDQYAFQYTDMHGFAESQQKKCPGHIGGRVSRGRGQPVDDDISVICDHDIFRMEIIVAELRILLQETGDGSLSPFTILSWPIANRSCQRL